jgi:hypothetical protein
MRKIWGRREKSQEKAALAVAPTRLNESAATGPAPATPCIVAVNLLQVPDMAAPARPRLHVDCR